jgi:hypothetical protein
MNQSQPFGLEFNFGEAAGADGGRRILIGGESIGA